MNATYDESGPSGLGMNEKEQPVSTTSKADRRVSTSRYLKLNRLPTLQEVLDRRTRAPLDLFCFYIFLQRESAEDALDFWLDVQQHENMCKAYFKDLRKSGRSVNQDWPEFAQYARENGSHYSSLLGPASEFQSPDLNAAPNQSTEKEASRRSSQIISPDRSPPIPSFVEGREEASREENDFGTFSIQDGSRPQRDRPSAAPTVGSGRLSIRDRWNERKVRAPTIITRDQAIQKGALVESAERIYLRYLLPGAEREIYLPPSLRIHSFPMSTEIPSPLIPDLFHAQKNYIFRALEQDAFPRFLRAKAFGNLTPLGSFVRLVAGLAVLWGGFVLGFSLIFLNHQPKRDRLWVILPFFIASNFLLSAYYSLSPLLAFLHQSETTPFRFIRVTEGYVRRLLLLRATWIEAVCIAITAILTIIFALVPGHRL